MRIKLFLISDDSTQHLTLCLFEGIRWIVVKDFLTTSSLSAGQEVERLSSELVGCRQHLEAVQKDGSQWQAEALSLAEQLANAQRQLHLTR